MIKKLIVNSKFKKKLNAVAGKLTFDQFKAFLDSIDINDLRDAEKRKDILNKFTEYLSEPEVFNKLFETQYLKNTDAKEHKLENELQEKLDAIVAGLTPHELAASFLLTFPDALHQKAADSITHNYNVFSQPGIGKTMTISNAVNMLNALTFSVGLALRQNIKREDIKNMIKTYINSFKNTFKIAGIDLDKIDIDKYADKFIDNTKEQIQNMPEKVKSTQNGTLDGLIASGARYDDLNSISSYSIRVPISKDKDGKEIVKTISILPGQPVIMLDDVLLNAKEIESLQALFQEFGDKGIQSALSIFTANYTKSAQDRIAGLVDKKPNIKSRLGLFYNATPIEQKNTLEDALISKNFVNDILNNAILNEVKRLIDSPSGKLLTTFGEDLNKEGQLSELRDVLDEIFKFNKELNKKLSGKDEGPKDLNELLSILNDEQKNNFLNASDEDFDENLSMYKNGSQIYSVFDSPLEAISNDEIFDEETRKNAKNLRTKLANALHKVRTVVLSYPSVGLPSQESAKLEVSDTDKKEKAQKNNKTAMSKLQGSGLGKKASENMIEKKSQTSDDAKKNANSIQKESLKGVEKELAAQEEANKVISSDQFPVNDHDIEAVLNALKGVTEESDTKTYTETLKRLNNRLMCKRDKATGLVQLGETDSLRHLRQLDSVLKGLKDVLSEDDYKRTATQLILGAFGFNEFSRQLLINAGVVGGKFEHVSEENVYKNFINGILNLDISDKEKAIKDFDALVYNAQKDLYKAREALGQHEKGVSVASMFHDLVRQGVNKYFDKIKNAESAEDLLKDDNIPEELKAFGKIMALLRSFENKDDIYASLEDIRYNNGKDYSALLQNNLLDEIEKLDKEYFNPDGFNFSDDSVENAIANDLKKSGIKDELCKKFDGKLGDAVAKSIDRNIKDNMPDDEFYTKAFAAGMFKYLK